MSLPVFCVGAAMVNIGSPISRACATLVQILGRDWLGVNRFSPERGH
ncbi:hypothetical protein Z948_832 [Sulfitobacter donghicola DSW-25 = KCTC 12864 = JCM 14565]|nr:hypothetical protein Z948_832 [Sulfitobacter donghicola DSW-25 = KCTC 12864 = JCM 14565]